MKQHAASPSNGLPPPPTPANLQTPSSAASRQPAPQYADPDLDEPPYDDDGDFYSDDDGEGEHYDDEDHHHHHHHHHPYGANGSYQPGYAHSPGASTAGKKSKKKKKGSLASTQLPYNPPPPARGHPAAPPPPALNASRKSGGTKKDRIWNTSSQEERERIREFWLSLGEDERKSLVKIEKEAVLRKMKEQQKHSCSCTVCGRKRTAIEEELEVLYDAYYEELEQYANHQQDVGALLPPANYGHASSAPHARRLMSAHHPPPGHYDDTDDLSHGEEDDGDQDYSQSEISSEEDYSEEEPSLPPPETQDFLQFGSSLQVKGGILTVADDLLKNDGKKFIEMMEQLAERRMQREEEAQYSAHPSMYRSHSSHNHGPPPEDEDFDDEEEDEEGYEDGDYEEDEEDEDDAMTEEQRMEEGRRMFQIFAARMFEQRVLQAYREKVAAERQQRLLEELAEEDDKKEAKEAKKAKEAQKRKEKKEKQKQAKAEEKARKEAEQAAKEAEARVAEEKRLEEQRKKKEEQRKKKEAERKAQEEEKARKEAERLKRQHEERERQQEAERKAREQKAQEKKARDEAKRKEREEREAREKEAREKKAHDDRERQKKAEYERARKEEAGAGASSKKGAQPVTVALPPQLLKQSSSTGFPSPHVTPAIPKAPTPNRPRQSSQQGSHGSSPKTPQVAPGTSKSMSPTSQMQNPIVPKSILTKPPTSQQPTPIHHAQPTSPMPPLGPPPGMQGPPGMGMNMPPGLNGFPHAQSSMLPGMMGPRHNMPIFPPQPGSQNFRPFPPPGMHAPGPMPVGRGFPMEGPPGFGPMPGFGTPTQLPGFGMGMPTHSRQTSGSFDKPTGDTPLAAPQAQPIQRPAPIQRPSSVKPHDEHKRHPGSDIDDLANHLGSKALLDDEEDTPEFPAEASRRTSLQQHGSMRGAPLGFGFPEGPGQARADSYAPFGGSSNAGSVWGTPPMPFPMAGAPGWGNSPTSSLFNNNPFAVIGAPKQGEPRLVWIRRMLCAACKTLASRQATTDGFVDAAELHHQVESMRVPSEPSISPQELRDACDLLPDLSNGGGDLEYKESSGRLSHIRYVESGGPAPTLGEIGSPVPGHSVPVSGFGARPFPGLGQAF
ncbi:hypothetical protein BS50DRAFT_493341 [Corynespora cassiicola Philippines]|uniref:Stress response protein NST1 n=1 Tax=Corynespora cassiicola Philippines TaxID=1448308 RepID=A0A2T2NN34_CORCC|nr:hypothetical protein BS50DRAFT_493341 [Corynespora cassiicola Philippines]